VPKEVEDRLKREAAEKFPGDKERQNAYVYSTLRKIEQRRGLHLKRRK
jgi:hypothetical protein